MIFSVIILSLVIVILLFKIRALSNSVRVEKELTTKTLSQKKSSEVRLGQISEQLAPFLTDFKYNPKKAHFLGMPIDYIIFEEDKIVFLEVKSGQAKLSTTQRAIKRLVENNKVVWEVMQIN